MFTSHGIIFGKVRKLSGTFGDLGNVDMKILRIWLRKSWEVYNCYSTLGDILCKLRLS